MIGRRGICDFAVALLLVVSIPAVLAAADSGNNLYKWIDKNGDLHITDRLAEVPEPYYSMYVAQKKEKEAKEQKQPKSAGKARPTQTEASQQNSSAVQASKPSGTPEWQKIERKRKAWKDEVARWRAALVQATDRVQALDEEIGMLKSNAVLAVTSPVRSKIQALMQKREAAVRRVDKARHVLAVELPARAKKEGVPYKWLL